jgi:hypothetical protein
MRINKRVLAVNGALYLALVGAFTVRANAMHVAYEPNFAVGQQEQEKPPTPTEEAKLKPVTLTGTVLKNGADYYLKDSGGTLYQLDASEKAEPLVGKSVKVSGKLEVGTNLVHVETIDAI